ncbi:hypothetical protein MtrunA17_Chr7g0251501 [Medicago truncatula]|uniref:Uncharacterized protein n=1 Tax=Medicago truncatula TaxID=3880 RepID=A0A396H6F1_MEDTR|nr:hypothetical protein MtrunA17_Chr7g0251501 [Medicago truncatula]
MKQNISVNNGDSVFGHALLTSKQLTKLVEFVNLSILGELETWSKSQWQPKYM